jgi:hypothetical protein
MPERAERILKLACLVLAVLFLAQVVGMSTRINPLSGAVIPEVPRWPPAGSTNMPKAAQPAGSAGSSNRAPPAAGAPSGVVMALPPGHPGAPAGFPGMPGPRPGEAPLPAAAQARIDQITQSGLLGPVIRPPPMALLGIVGRDVLLRAPNGQSGLVREGGELGGIQLLRIGTNRVLVRENGVEKELLIFGGLGGESLLSQKKGDP